MGYNVGQELLMTDHNPPSANQVDVDGQVLEEAITRMLSVGDPLQVILFGSRARGDAQPDSDYDLLVIEESAAPRYRRAAKYRRALFGLLPSKDILVWTPDEAAEWADVPQALVTTAIREGVILYEREE